MKKWIMTIGLCVLSAVMLIALPVVASAVSSPNYGYSNELPDGSTYAYVQCQPSYVESNGKQAARASIDYYYVRNNVQHYANRVYTPFGNDPNDSRILSTSKNLSVISGWTPVIQFKFEWVTAGSGYWPVSVPGEIE